MAAKRALTIPGVPANYTADLITAVILSTIGVVLLSLGQKISWFAVDIVPDAVALPVLIVTGFIGTLFARRSVLSATSFLIGLSVDLLSGVHSFALWLIFQLIFSVVGHAPDAVSKWVFKLSLTATFIAGIAALASGSDLSMAFQYLLLTGAVLFVPALWASNVREHANLAEAERERAEAERARAEAEHARADDQATLLTLTLKNAEADAKIAAAKVRSAAAEDLHDLVAGHISAIALQSQAALASDDTGLRDQVMRTVHESADRALTELRRMIEVLSAHDDVPARHEPDDRTPLGNDPSLAHSRPAAASVRETLDLAGMLGINVRGAEVCASLDSEVECALRPVFAEIVANVFKHASRPEMTIVRLSPELISIANPHEHALARHSSHDSHEDGPVTQDSRVTGTGRGLDNISGRMHRLGGDLLIEFTDSTFTLRLILPAGPLQTTRKKDPS